MEILKDLFDEKIIEIISLFIENPEKQYSLTQVSNLTKINVTTTFRILNKLVAKEFLKTTVIGKIKVYQLEKSKKTLELIHILKGGKEEPLQEFIKQISPHPRVKKIILESKDNYSAKILIIGDFLPTEKINRICEEIKNKYNFKINFVEISENQYAKLRDFKNYELEKKIIWERKPLQA